LSETKKKKKVIAAIKMKKGAAKRVNTSSVRDKQAYFTLGISALQEGVRIMQAGITEQMNKNKKSVGNMQAGITALVNATQEYTKMFYG